jgi:uncharacterized protein YbjT (DUF2867 family)
MTYEIDSQPPVLVIGSTGKTGRRVTERLEAAGVPVRNGPRLLTFADALAEISAASGRPLRLVRVSLDEFRAGMEQAGVPADVVALLEYLFGEVLDGRNAQTTDDVRQALGREPRDFRDYAQRTAADGAWRAAR